LRHENRHLKDKVVTLSNDIDRMSRARAAADPALQNEISRLKHELSDLTQENEYLVNEVKMLKT
jgi:uncharacterized protein YlxW (UPF0749 family)